MDNFLMEIGEEKEDFDTPVSANKAKQRIVDVALNKMQMPL